MRAFGFILALVPLVSATEVSLRGAERALYPATFGGYAYSGPTRNQPVNACYHFSREPMSFDDCDGKNAADAYCRERGWEHATTFQTRPLKNIGSTVIMSDGQQVEAGIGPAQNALYEVTCDRPNN